MGRPPSNGGPSFRFNSVEVGEMEAILQAHHYAVPAREILEALAQRFSATAERAGKVEVSGKQVWNWFQNRRYALRARAAKAPAPAPVQANVHALPMPIPRDDQATVRNGPQAPQPQTAPPSVKSVPQSPHPLPAPSGQSVGRNTSDSTQMEFEAKSARDGAWYDVTLFLSHRSLETGDPEAMVRFAGFGPEEDEWVNIRRHVRQRSLPCESSECVAVLPGDLILCFQEGKEQALYFDAHVLDAQRRRHDVRGCRCRFLVRYDHDQSEEIVPLRKICRRPETDFRLQQLQAESTTLIPQKQKPVADSQALNTLKTNAISQAPQMQPKTEQHTGSVPYANFPPRVESGVTTTVPQANVTPRVESGAMTTVPQANVPPRVESGAMTTVPQANLPPHVEHGAMTTVPLATVPPRVESGATTTVLQANVAPHIESGATVTSHQANVAPRIESGAMVTVPQANVPPHIESGSTVTVPQASVAPRVESGSMTTVPQANVPPRVETGPTTTPPQVNVATVPQSDAASGAIPTAVPQSSADSGAVPTTVPQSGGASGAIPTTIPQSSADSGAVSTTVPQSAADSGTIPTTVPAAGESKLPESQANPETAELKS